MNLFVFDFQHYHGFTRATLKIRAFRRSLNTEPVNRTRI